MIRNNRAKPSSGFKSPEDEFPFIRFTTVQETGNTHITSYQCIELSILEFIIEGDTSTIFTFVADLLDALPSAVTYSEYLATHHPVRW